MKFENKRLTILSEAEEAALYEVPDFDDEQRLNYLNLTAEEQTLVQSCSDLSTKIHCALQIAYFKSKHLFFRVNWSEAEEDVQFIFEQYFPDETLNLKPITQYHYYSQCVLIAKHFGYQLWEKKFESVLLQQVHIILRKDVSPQFIVMELLAFLQVKKIMRPRHTKLQDIISEALYTERKRLSIIINASLNETNKACLDNLLKEESALSGLADLKRDAKDFKARMMSAEKEKMLAIKPLYQMAKLLLPTLKLSQQNIDYYAGLVHYYTIYDLRKRIKPEQAYLYLLCYIWQRYRQLSDNLMDASCFHLKQFEGDLKLKAKEAHAEYALNQQSELIVMRRLARYFIADEIADTTQFGDIRESAFSTIISKEELIAQVSGPDAKELKEMDFQWKVIDQHFHRYRLHLRPLMMALDFSSVVANNPWLNAIHWLKKTLSLEKELRDCQEELYPEKTIPKRLKAYLLENNSKGEQTLNIDRYEFWVYRQIKRQIKLGKLHLEDSVHNRSLQQELKEAVDKGALTQPLNIPALNMPIRQLLDERCTELSAQWKSFYDNFNQGKLKHLYWDEKTKTLHFKKTKDEYDEELQHRFYEQLPLKDIADILHFVNNSSRCLSAFTHVQPRYSKMPADENSLNATILAQALNNGNMLMAEICDIPYVQLLDTYQSRIRLQTMKKANDMISDDIFNMPIFSSYSLDLTFLYAGVDGQKYEVERPTLKARRSKKYFKKGKGVVAYTMLSNHIPLQSELIGAHDHESYYAFDIWYNNTSTVMPHVLTGDMHIINKGNFALLDWFGGKLYPRFTNLQTQTKHLYCSDDPKQYAGQTICPVGQIDRSLIEEEWPNIFPIISALGLKEISQSILIKKLCTYTTDSRTCKAIFEYDKLIRSIYTLKYFQDRKLQRDVHRSQNRVESYHQLRAVIASVYGKKQLIGKSDREIEISNQCGRMIANAIIHYNSAILSMLKVKYEAEGNHKALAILKKISPVAWRHIHFQGHFVFLNNAKIIDLEAMVSKVVLQSRK